MDNYYYINQNENTEKIWTNNYLGNLVKSTYNPKTNKIKQKSMEYNFPENYINYFNNNSQVDFNASRKKVLNDLFIYNDVINSNNNNS
jgi:hypothetical protein